MLTDITARKSTAEAMHLCDKALAATSEATLITDSSKPDNPIIYCNSSFTKLFGEIRLQAQNRHPGCPLRHLSKIQPLSPFACNFFCVEDCTRARLPEVRWA